jgi:hypothetical protein
MSDSTVTEPVGAELPLAPAEDTSKAVRKGKAPAKPKAKAKVKLQEPKPAEAELPTPEDLATAPAEPLHTYRVKLPHWSKFVAGQKVDYLDVRASDKDGAIEEFKKATDILATQHAFEVQRHPLPKPKPVVEAAPE